METSAAKAAMVARCLSLALPEEESRALEQEIVTEAVSSMPDFTAVIAAFTGQKSPLNSQSEK